MQSVVADTHALIWHLTSPRKLGKAARRPLGEADTGRRLCYVPVIALVETSLLHERGRLRIGPAQVASTLAGHPDYTLLPLDLEQALAFDALAGLCDPMDRLMVAAARATRSVLISIDESLDGYGVERRWS